MIRVLLLLAAAVAAFAWWRLSHRHKLHKHRSRHLRVRLHLRLHPGRGHATALELWWRWGRFASYRESKRTRPSLPRMTRMLHPATHSSYMGRAHHGRTVRVPVQEHGALIGPPRSNKTAALSLRIMTAPGAVVCTSTKTDLFDLTSGLRAQRGPVYVFNPGNVGGIPSNVRWSPLEGCREPAVAIRRADAFTTAVSSSGTEDGSFWSAKASDGLRAMFAAAALADRDIRQVAVWVGGSARAAVGILAQHGRDGDAATAAELDGPAEKTAGTIRMFMSRALAFLRDPALAASVVPGTGEGFDIDGFLRSGGTLYMIASGEGEESPLAPLFAALASEIQFRGTRLAALSKGGRLDPPLTMVLDEITNICPVPLPSWLADSGGQGISIWTGFHGFAQLRARWGQDGAQTIMDTSNVKMIMPGLADAEMLAHVAQLCGQAAYAAPDQEQHSWHDVLTMGMIRQLPNGFALLIRGSCAPVVIKVAKGWKHRPYRRLHRKAKGHTAAIITAPPAKVPVLTVVPEPEPVTVEWSPSAVLAAHGGNGNGHDHADDGTPWWAGQ